MAIKICTKWFQMIQLALSLYLFTALQPAQGDFVVEIEK